MLAPIVRWALPGGLAFAGLVLLAVSAGDDTTLALGVLLIGIGLIVAVWNAFLRLSFSSQADRAREQRARGYFSRHGRWPRESR